MLRAVFSLYLSASINIADDAESVVERFKHWGSKPVPEWSSADKEAWDLLDGCWTGIMRYDGHMGTKPPSREFVYCCYLPGDSLTSPDAFPEPGIPVNIDVSFYQATDIGVPVMEQRYTGARFVQHRGVRFDLLFGAPDHLYGQLDMQNIWPLRNFKSIDEPERKFMLASPTRLADNNATGLHEVASHIASALPTGTTALNCVYASLSEDRNTLTMSSMAFHMATMDTSGIVPSWLGVVYACPEEFSSLPVPADFPPKPSGCTNRECVHIDKSLGNFPKFSDLDRSRGTASIAVLSKRPKSHCKPDNVVAKAALANNSGSLTIDSDTDTDSLIIIAAIASGSALLLFSAAYVLWRQLCDSQRPKEADKSSDTLAGGVGLDEPEHTKVIGASMENHDEQQPLKESAVAGRSAHEEHPESGWVAAKVESRDARLWHAVDEFSRAESPDPRLWQDTEALGTWHHLAASGSGASSSAVKHGMEKIHEMNELATAENPDVRLWRAVDEFATAECPDIRLWQDAERLGTWHHLATSGSRPRTPEQEAVAEESPVARLWQNMGKLGLHLTAPDDLGIVPCAGSINEINCLENHEVVEVVPEVHSRTDSQPMDMRNYTFAPSYWQPLDELCTSESTHAEKSAHRVGPRSTVNLRGTGFFATFGDSLFTDASTEVQEDGFTGDMREVISKGVSEHWVIPSSCIKFFNTLGKADFRELRRGRLLDSLQVAVKVAATFARSDQLIATHAVLANELRMLRQVSHQNIVTFHGVLLQRLPEGSIQFGIVLEWISEFNLEAYCKGRHAEGAYCANALPSSKDAIGEQKDRGLLVDILRGMLYLHTLVPSILHGDLNPANILLDNAEPPQAKLMDFGLKPLMSHVFDIDKKAALTSYVAPEIRHGRTFSKMADVFAFGCVALFLLTGQHPPEDNAAPEVAQAYAHTKRWPDVVFNAACSALRLKPTLRPTFASLYSTFTGAPEGEATGAIPMPRPDSPPILEV